jgi:peptide alpha-N-acetyltransferase
MSSKKPGATNDQVLPLKFSNLFKQIVKNYELKQYKKGIKNADQILKSHPNNGETLAMKGLILSCMEKQSEAEESIRKGLKMNLKSHVCWHVYGLMHRANRNYGEAIKCYLNALRIDPVNILIFMLLRN